METYIGSELFDIEKFAESLAAVAREGVKWERKKLEWVFNEEDEQTQRQRSVDASRAA